MRRILFTPFLPLFSGFVLNLQSELPLPWLVAGVVLFLMLLFAVLVIAVVIFLVMRRRGKARTLAPGGSAPAVAPPTSAKPSASLSPPPTPAYTPAAPAAIETPSPRTPAPARAAESDAGKTVDLSATIAIQPDTSPINFGSIKFTSGALAGKQFDVTSEGACIGRDSTLSQIVIADPRISKRHLWIGVRDGQVTIIDQDSRNGTFVNDPKSPRVTETTLNSGDIVILGESDVARFEYRK